jgi:hypothetical protein
MACHLFRLWKQMAVKILNKLWAARNNGPPAQILEKNENVASNKSLRFSTMVI